MTIILLVFNDLVYCDKVEVKCSEAYEPNAKVVNGNLLPHFGRFLRQYLFVLELRYMEELCTLFRPKNSLDEALQRIRPDFYNWLLGRRMQGCMDRYGL